MEIQGKAAIVTGAGTGVGRATALQLADRGCAVLVNYSRSRDAAEAVAGEAEKRGVKALAFKADVAEDAQCCAMVREAERAFGGLDVLVNNAGTTKFVPHAQLEDLDIEDWNRILQVNLVGPFQCSRAAADLLAATDGGEIVMTSSIAGIVGIGSSIAYCASKAGLNNLTVTLARVLGPRNIRVNAIAPGFIDGEWLQQGLGDAYEAVKQGMQAKSPIGKVTTPEDIATAILSVITGTDLITGHVIPVEGGMLIGG
ncbi:MAG: SDR family oxidoreductase [bacterium]|nr:SDR family oxidoreductase [bacterium]MCP5045016.1 SDR family oxidoreductase [bacterium]